ncbi:hypothetical protein B0H11DRAFT_2254346 [Mycena galericulata]|nr:hypothetical protein B0H11DRAFT_2254346 [Mycena galericulata]
MGRRGHTRSNGPDVDESDPASVRRYQKWRSSFLYNDRNRAERNDKKRQRMEILRAKQSLDSPKVQMARLAAKRASAAKYRESNRARLAMKSRQRRDVHSLSMSAYRCEPPFYPDPGQPPEPVAGQRVYLVCGVLVKHAGVYASWHSAEAEYSGVSNAALKGFTDWRLLRSAWHARCDLGEHDHPARLTLVDTAPAPVLPAQASPRWTPSQPAATPGHIRQAPRTLSPTPVGTQQNPRRRAPSLTQALSPARMPSPPPCTPSPVQSFVIDSRSASPASDRSASLALPEYSTDGAGLERLTVYAVRAGTEGEIFTNAQVARTHFLELHRDGRHPRFAVSQSVDRAIAWIEGTAPSP